MLHLLEKHNRVLTIHPAVELNDVLIFSNNLHSSLKICYQSLNLFKIVQKNNLQEYIEELRAHHKIAQLNRI